MIITILIFPPTVEWFGGREVASQGAPVDVGTMAQ